MNGWEKDRVLADALWREWPIVGAHSIFENDVWLKKPVHKWRERDGLTWDEAISLPGVEFWGFKTGPVSEGGSGIILIEFDGEVGEDTFSRLGLEPNARSGSGGAHLYVEAPDWYVAGGQKNKKWDADWPGMDVRGWHQLAYFHGTSHKGTYQLFDFKPYPVSALPEDLARVLGLLEPPNKPERTEWDGTSSTDWGMAALAGECRTLSDTDSDRLNAAYISALKLGSIVAADSLDGDTARDALVEAARQNGSVDVYGLTEVERAIDNGMKQGVANGPRGPKSAVLGTFDARPYLAKGEIPEEFWSSRPVLRHIRQAAHSRQRSAPAVLHAVLARVAASVPYYWRLPDVVGSTATLSYFACVVAPSGVGKSTSNAIASELIVVGDHVADQLPLGSGEGLAEILFDMVSDPDEPKKKVKKQVRHNAYVYVDEGQLIASIGKRDGSSLLPTLRSIWSGGTIGQTNASSDRRRIVQGSDYVYGVYAGLQDSMATALLDDVDGGTPQRFGWARATDPTIPEESPEWPGVIDWKPAVIQAKDTWQVLQGAKPEAKAMTIAESIRHQIRKADLAKARGEMLVNPLDGHAGLYRLKVAGLLSVLDGRFKINEEDWRLAGMVQKASDAVRNSLVTQSIEEAKAREQAIAKRYAARAVVSAEAVERRRIVTCSRKIAEKVHSRPESWTKRKMQQAMTNYRDVFQDALNDALAEGWIVEGSEPGRGTKQKTLLPGKALNGVE